MPTQSPSYAILLTGGSGFIGKTIVKELLAEDSPINVSLIRVFDLAPFHGVTDPRIEVINGDIRDRNSVSLACQGIDIVIHSAAIVDWGTKPAGEVYAVNFTGTKNIVEACRINRIKYLLYTSTLDVIYTGKPQVDIDETVPYPTDHPNMYCQSKYLAEKLVLESNSVVELPGEKSEPGFGLTTCVLRPCDVYGPDDPFHMGSLIDMAKGGFYVRLGNGTAKSQHVFVGNIARAHVEAAAALLAGNRAVAGQAYFISDGPPSNFFSFFDGLVEGAGYRIWPKNLWIPARVAYALGAISEFFAFLIRPIKQYNPKFSRFAVNYTCNDLTFKTRKAEHDFGYTPKYSKEQAFRETTSHYRQIKATS